MEGNVYLCDWKKIKGRYTLWSVDNPALQAISPDLDTAEEELCGLICEKLGDGEAVLEYTTSPRPIDRELAPYATPEIYTVAGNGWAIVENKNELFDGGCCALCRNPIGQRTQVPYLLSTIEPGDGAIAHLFPGQFFSENFLARLDPTALHGLEFRPVQTLKKIRTQYYELAGPGHLQYKAVHNFPGFSGGQCPECGFSTFSYMYKNNLVQFIEQESFQFLKRECFTIQGSIGVMLGLSGKLWRTLKTTCRKMAGARIYLAPKSAILETIQFEQWDRSLFKKKDFSQPMPPMPPAAPMTRDPGNNVRYEGNQIKEILLSL